MLKNAAHFLEELLHRVQQAEPRVQRSLAAILFQGMARLSGGVGQIMNLVAYEEDFSPARSRPPAVVPPPLAHWVFDQLEDEHILRAIAEVGPGAPGISYANRLPARILVHLTRRLLESKSFEDAFALGRLSARLVDFGPEHVPLIELLLERGLMAEKGENALWNLAPERAWQRVIKELDEPTPLGMVSGPELLKAMPTSLHARFIEELATREPGARPDWVLQWLRAQVRAGGALSERAHALLFRA